jgi:magnesium-protoporphyrin O-methyltransferase
VEAVDLSPTLLDLAADRAPTDLPGMVTFRAGDMLDPSGGPVDHVVAMDSLIHYGLNDMVEMLIGLSRRAEKSIIFTFAPRTPALTVMHAAGKLFPKSDRSPAIIPVGERALRKRIEACEALKDWRVGRTERVDSFFYISQAMELVRA